MTTLILRTTARLLAPLIVALSLFLLVRGHNAPGGGFIAALVAGAALVLRFLAFGVADTRRLVPLHFTTLAAVGLLVAVGSALGGYVLEGVFFGGDVWAFALPFGIEIKVAWSLVFDLGVFVVVLSVIVALVRYLGAPVPEER